MQIVDTLGKVFGSKQDRDVKRFTPFVERVNALAEEMSACTDEQLKQKTEEFRARLLKGETLEELLPEAFAVVRETTFRVLGERRMVHDPILDKDIPFMAHFDVQIMGGVVLHQGKIAEMRTGEGKTQVAALAAYLNALGGRGVHVITVNDYLAKRDSEWMGRIFTFLGLTVGCLDATEPSTTERRRAYECDIVYGTNNEFGFDYLRDNMASSPEQCVQRELNYAIIDEVDNILVDEARTPLIISGPVTKSNREYEELRPRVQKLVNAQSRLTQKTVAEAEELLKQEGKEFEAGYKLLQVQRGSPKNKRLTRLLKEPGVAKAMKTVEAEYLRDKRLHEIDEELFYVIDESGHSAEMTDKGRHLTSENNPEFFVVPDLSEELARIDNDESLDFEQKAEKKDEAHRAYAERSERIHSVSQLLRAYSVFERDVDYVVQEGQILIVDEFTGRILHGRRYSEGLHQALEAKEGVRVAGENQTLATITFQNYFKLYRKIAGMTGTAATEAAEFQEIYKLDVVTVPTNRPMIRQDMDDEIYKTQREKYNAIVEEIREVHEAGRPILVGTTSIEKSELLSKLLSRKGIQHEVLNAKQHAREAAIVAQAGRLGAVTIATNMAGRGTDIVLGGNFEIMAEHELLKEGMEPADVTLEDKRRRYAKLSKELREEHNRVVELGGLHIVGTERHEARRIDNQLRGRAGRQGDPGSSRFFVSFEDDLMRIFAPESMRNWLKKAGMEDGMALESKMVSRWIEKAQKRVEEYNFDIRKNLLEYDEVLDEQRKSVYSWRQKLVENEDVEEELQTLVEDAVRDGVDTYIDSELSPEEWDIEGLEEWFERKFRQPPEIPEEAGVSIDALEECLIEQAKELFREKCERIGKEPLLDFGRTLMLRTIDMKWKDHLHAMDVLRSGIGLRGYAQLDPKIEYTSEGGEMFENMLMNIADEVTDLFFRVEVEEREEREVEGVWQVAETRHDSFRAEEAFDESQLSTSGGGGGGSQTATKPIEVGEKVGRNDPCPCGSGKKYKHCCGKIGK